MIYLFKAVMSWSYWDSILSVPVIFHLASEYCHYIGKLIASKRYGNILKDAFIKVSEWEKTQIKTTSTSQ